MRHQRSGHRILLHEAVVNSAMSIRDSVTAGHHVSAKVMRCAQTPSRSVRPRASGVGAQRRTLHGVEHSARLEGVMAGMRERGQNLP